MVVSIMKELLLNISKSDNSRICQHFGHCRLRKLRGRSKRGEAGESEQYATFSSRNNLKLKKQMSFGVCREPDQDI